MSGYKDERVTFDARSAALSLAVARARDADKIGKHLTDDAIVQMAALFARFLDTGASHR